MSFGLGFNHMNSKDSNATQGMYSEWASLHFAVQNTGDSNQSVLQNFNAITSKEVTISLVHQLASNLGITHPAEPSAFKTDKEVQWCMEVICFGLSLPLTEHEAIKDCTNIYCEWLSALLPTPKICVPIPIVDDPNVYCRRIITHLHSLFVPRKGEEWPFIYQDMGIDTINRQAVLCHRVLRTIQQIAHESKVLTEDTWQALLLFLLAINDTLLSPPTVKDDVADQLCERVLSVLFEIWLIACAQCFPSPSLWKTLREYCMNWRHRVALIEQWNRINLALTSKVLVFMYGPSFPELKLGEEDINIHGMSNDCIVQSWYRFLNTIGNPISLTKPEVISQTPKFRQCALSAGGTMDPNQHPCLEMLPLIFLKAIKGIAGQVDAFLGIAQPLWWQTVVVGNSNVDKNKTTISASSTTVTTATVTNTGSSSGSVFHSPTPPTQRRLAKSFSVTQTSIAKGTPKASLISLTTSRQSAIPPSIANPQSSSTSALSFYTTDPKVPLAPLRPKCNSILHLFGEWLFEAAFIGSSFQQKVTTADSSKRPNSIVSIDTRTGNQAPFATSSSDAQTVGIHLTHEKFESGKAEAHATLCRVMCSKKTGEEILAVYLARFYLAIQHGLYIGPNRRCDETMVAILMNSSDLFRLDLDGVRVLLPVYLSALELVLSDKDVHIPTNVNKTDLRRSAINLLSSILVLPLHFQNTVIRELTNSGGHSRSMTFAQLKPRLMNVLMNTLQIETDPQNTHMLLGCLFLCVQDSAMFERVEQIIQPSAECSSNLLSSASDTASTMSIASSCDRSTSPDYSHAYEQHEPSSVSQSQLDSAHALFVRATYLVCHRLISTWKTDLNTSLAALELLTGLARTHIKESDVIECKRAVKWICDYIIYQCSRPPPAHSKDLHSTIVAAFYCCVTWLLEHPYLLQDKECLNTVLEVVELGISGTKSVGKLGEPLKMKECKELKPVSMRVRDAADHLLTCILEQVGYFPSECGPESISSFLDEVSLLQHCNSWPVNSTNHSKAIDRFRYFIIEGSILLALLEEPLGNDQDAQPTLTVLIRGPFGRQAWTMQLRHLPRHRSGTKYHAPNPGRPVVMQDIPIRTQIKQKYFPDGVDRVPLCKVDQSIPSLESVLVIDGTIHQETNKLDQLLEKQSSVEEELLHTQSVYTPQECTPPPVCHDFQTARLFLSHFGLLSLDDSENDIPNLCALNTNSVEFCNDLLLVDHLSPRTYDTLHIFYMKSQQYKAEDIVNNANNEATLSQYFLEFIHTLGWPVKINQHTGWTGHISTSWKVCEIDNSEEAATLPGSLYDGTSQILYWADACSEIAFVMPSSLKQKRNSSCGLPEKDSNNSMWSERSLSESTNAKTEYKPTSSFESEKQPIAPRRSGVHRSSISSQSSIAMMVVWLESFEDHLEVPIADLLPCTNTGGEKQSPKANEIFIIYIHLMATGLLRVRLQGPTGKVGLASPLIDGMVVSRRALGPLIRSTTLNMARRRRLDSDSYQPPHVKRRLKIQEMAQKFKKEMTKPELLTYLFNGT